jgi:hypothetical protein
MNDDNNNNNTHSSVLCQHCARPNFQIIPSYVSCLCETCLVEDHKESLLRELGAIDDTLDASKKQNHLYRSFVRSEYGQLGARTHLKIPDCDVSFIRSICPSADGNYSDFCLSGTAGVSGGGIGLSGVRGVSEEALQRSDDKLEDEPVEENEVGDESFKEVKNDFKPHTTVNFAVGEKKG